MNNVVEQIVYELQSRGYINGKLNDDVIKAMDNIMNPITEQLERKEQFIELLECNGVNNHSGWDNAISELNAEDEN